MRSLVPQPTALDETLSVSIMRYPAGVEARIISPYHSSGRKSLQLTALSVASSDFPECGCLFIKPLADYAGPTSPNLDTLNQNAVALFVEADKSYFAATGRYLQIESGRRTVNRQAELYICWRLGQAGCNPADIPGASVHNYGFAIDIRSSTESAVVNALAGNGWTRTVLPNEPWHWEASNADGYAAAKQRQQAMKAQGSIARQWQAEWESARTKNDIRNKKIDTFNARLAVWQPAWDQLRVEVEQFQRDADSYNQRADRWNSDRDLFIQWITQYNSEYDALIALRQRIESMPPSPERDALIDEYNRRATALNAEGARLQQVKADLEARSAILNQEHQSLQSREFDLQQRYSTLNAERESLLLLRDEIERLLQEVEKHLAKAKELLDRIATTVGPP